MLRRGLRGDGGASTVEYGAVIILVAALLVTIGFTVLPEQVKTNTTAAICELFKGKDCRAPAADPVAGQTPEASPEPSAPTATVPAGDPQFSDAEWPDSPTATDPNQKAYDDAKAESDAATRNVGDTDNQATKARQEVIDFLKDLVGLTDLENCLKSGDLVACLNTLVNVVPWGKVFKLLKKIPGAIRLAKRLKKLWDDATTARKREAAAKKALKDAEDLRKAKKLPTCPVKKPSSFAPGTLVLLADGSHRPVEQVRVGDQVWATDPETGVSGPRPVTDLISSQGLKHLVELSTTPFSRLVATDAHPFWLPEAGQWTPAGALLPGAELSTVDGGTATLSAVWHRTALWQRVHNLTVADLHSYYVLVGGRDVLVHNSARADEDWCAVVAAMSPEQLAEARRIRGLYHGLIKKMRQTEGEMRAAGASSEDIARKLVDLRNGAKDITRAGMDPKAVAGLEARNQAKYGNPLGPTADDLLAKYGSWDAVIEASKRTNPALDSALGLDPP